MANLSSVLTLPGDQSRLKIVEINITGADILDIQAGVYKELDLNWRLVSLYLTLVCDATVASRYMSAHIGAGAGVLQVGTQLSSAAVTASQSRTFSVASYVVLTNSATIGEASSVGIGDNLIFGGEERLRLQVKNGVAGDILTGRARLEFRGAGRGYAI